MPGHFFSQSELRLAPSAYFITPVPWRSTN